MSPGVIRGQAAPRAFPGTAPAATVPEDRGVAKSRGHLPDMTAYLDAERMGRKADALVEAVREYDLRVAGELSARFWRLIALVMFGVALAAVVALCVVSATGR